MKLQRQELRGVFVVSSTLQLVGCVFRFMLFETPPESSSATALLAKLKARADAPKASHPIKRDT